MSSTEKDRSKITEINCGRTYSAFFTADGKHLLSASSGSIRRWQVDDGREVDTAIQLGGAIDPVALSMDGKWLVCGLQSQPYVGVWNAETQTKALDICRDGHTCTVHSVDISPDSATFATGGSDNLAFIWSISTSKKLVGPLQHTSAVVAVRFSPDGARLATASVGGSIRIFNSDDGHQLIDIPCPFNQFTPNSNQYRYNSYNYGYNSNQDRSSPLAWSADGHHIFAVSAPMKGAKCFNTSSGFVVSSWSAHGGSFTHPCIAPSSNQKFIGVTGDRSLSFWDASTHQQIGPVIEHSYPVFFLVLSTRNDYVVTGEQSDYGKVTIRSLRDILPDRYLTRQVNSQLPLMQTSDVTFEAWTQGDLSRVEQVLTKEMLLSLSPSRHAQVLAQRSLVRSRLKQYGLAIDDATKSVEVQRSAIGQIAITIARAGGGEHDAAMRMFDLAFTNNSSTNINLVLLIKAIVLFECGRHDEAISRVEDLISIVDDKTMYVTVQAQMHLQLADMSFKEGDHERAAELLRRAADAAICEKYDELVVISLMFGWNFDGLAVAIEQHLQQYTKALEDIGDVAMESEKAEEAISSYTAALSLNPLNRAGFLIKRSRAWSMQMSWEDSLKDADEAIKSDPQDLWGYERRHGALHASHRYDEAVDTLNRMVSLTENPLANLGAQCKCHGGGGCGNAAVAHVLEDIVSRLGEAAVLAWTGHPSSYNSCLPGTLAIHNPASHPSPAIDDAEMDARVAELESSMSPTDAMILYDRFIPAPPTRFVNRKLYLPCILFQVKKLVERDATIGEEKCYRARVSGIGHVEFWTSDKLSLSEPRRLAFAHPWIRDLRGSAEEEPCGDLSDGEDAWSDSDVEEDSLSPGVASEAEPDMAASLYTGPVARMDVATRALRLIVRLQQPFRALLLQQQSHGGYKRVASEHEIVVPGLEQRMSAAKDVRIEVVEIL